MFASDIQDDRTTKTHPTACDVPSMGKWVRRPVIRARCFGHVPVLAFRISFRTNELARFSDGSAIAQVMMLVETDVAL